MRVGAESEKPKALSQLLLEWEKGKAHVSGTSEEEENSSTLKKKAG